MASGRRVTHQINKVDGEVELAQRLAALEVLDLGDVVERKVEVVELLQPVQTLDLRYEIVLQVDDLQATAAVEYLDLVDVELVQRYLLERAQHALVVLRLAADQVLGEWYTIPLGISLQSRRGGRRLLFLLLALTLALRLRLFLLVDLLDHRGVVDLVVLLDEGHALQRPCCECLLHCIRGQGVHGAFPRGLQSKLRHVSYREHHTFGVHAKFEVVALKLSRVMPPQSRFEVVAPGGAAALALH